MLSTDAVALRVTFMIDKEGIVRHQVVNHIDLGRNIDDVQRTLDALQHSEKLGDVFLANWEEGKQSMNPTHAGVKK